MRERGDDRLLDPPAATRFDDEEWTWSAPDRVSCGNVFLVKLEQREPGDTEIAALCSWSRPTT